MSDSQSIKDPVREEILNGARELFERFGFKKTTMEDIARQIGKSKSALYYYFKTKEEIFEAFVLNEIETAHRLVTELVAKEESAAKKFRVLVISLLKDVKQKANRFPLFKTDLFENHFMLENIIKQRDSYIEDQIKDMLILGISQHEVKMLSNAEMTLWAKMINIMLRSLGSEMFREDDFHLSENQLGFMADTLFQGVKA